MIKKNKAILLKLPGTKVHGFYHPLQHESPFDLSETYREILFLTFLDYLMPAYNALTCKIVDLTKTPTGRSQILDIEIPFCSLTKFSNNYPIIEAAKIYRKYQ